MKNNENHQSVSKTLNDYASEFFNFLNAHGQKIKQDHMQAVRDDITMDFPNVRWHFVGLDKEDSFPTIVVSEIDGVSYVNDKAKSKEKEDREVLIRAYIMQIDEIDKEKFRGIQSMFECNRLISELESKLFPES